jgi:hypothetical protein
MGAGRLVAIAALLLAISLCLSSCISDSNDELQVSPLSQVSPLPVATFTPSPTFTATPVAMQLVVLHTNDNWGETEPCG